MTALSTNLLFAVLLQTVIDHHQVLWEFLCTCYGCQYALSRVGKCDECVHNTPPAPGACGELPTSPWPALAAALIECSSSLLNIYVQMAMNESVLRAYPVNAVSVIMMCICAPAHPTECSRCCVSCSCVLQHIQAVCWTVPHVLQGCTEATGK